MANSTSPAIPAELERKMDEAIARYPSDHRRSAAMPLLHLWQEHFGFISDEAVLWIEEAGLATDQYSGAGNILSDVSTAAGGQNAYPRLPHAQLRDGRRFRAHGKFVRCP